jgi:Ca2+-binding EF-hand superfamily protein
MTLKNTLMSAALVASFTFAGTAFAQPEGGGQMRRQMMLEKFDANGDGQIDESERQAARAYKQQRRAQMLEKYDTNRDGKLDETEKQAMRADHAERRFRELDKNNDGVVTLDEFKAGAGGPHGKFGGKFKGRR